MTARYARLSSDIKLHKRAATPMRKPEQASVKFKAWFCAGLISLALWAGIISVAMHFIAPSS